jgi:hypothetical protein
MVNPITALIVSAMEPFADAETKFKDRVAE